jgi:hypothetical protein
VSTPRIATAAARAAAVAELFAELAAVVLAYRLVPDGENTDRWAVTADLITGEIAAVSPSLGPPGARSSRRGRGAELATNGKSSFEGSAMIASNGFDLRVRMTAAATWPGSLSHSVGVRCHPELCA